MSHIKGKESHIYTSFIGKNYRDKYDFTLYMTLWAFFLLFLSKMKSYIKRMN